MTTLRSSDGSTSAETSESSRDSILQAIPWRDVVAVGIRATADGPFLDDLFWQFLTPQRCFEVPSQWVDAAGLEVLARQLPGLNWDKALRALFLTRERIVRVWHRDGSPNAMTRGALGDRYRELIARLGGDATGAAEAFDAVYGAWASDGRSYHGVLHLVECLRALDSTPPDNISIDVVELALWYHDVIYDPRASDNEARSAQRLLQDAARVGLPSMVAGAAADLVRATVHTGGAGAQVTAEAALIADIDLSIFGADSIGFMDFEYGVEEEYAHVPKFWFLFRRGQFLANLLKRPQLFRTAAFRTRYEQAARAQIAALLASPRYRTYRWLRWLG